MHTQQSQHPMSLSRAGVSRLERWEAAGLMSLALLVAALFSPVSVRVLLSSAGLLGVAGFRLAAAHNGWARRGAAWSKT
jgi:hypothetical protein